MTHSIQQEHTNALHGNIRRRAFTLIELVIVMIIIAVTAAVVVPRFSSANSNYRVDAAVQQLLADVNIESATANMESTGRSVTFNTSNDTYRLDDRPSEANPVNRQVVDLSGEPYRVNMIGADFGGDNTLSISGFGLIEDGGTVTLTTGTYAMSIVTIPGSGRVQLTDYSLNEPALGEAMSVKATLGTVAVEVSNSSAPLRLGIK